MFRQRRYSWHILTMFRFYHYLSSIMLQFCIKLSALSGHLVSRLPYMVKRSAFLDACARKRRTNVPQLIQRSLVVFVSYHSLIWACVNTRIVFYLMLQNSQLSDLIRPSLFVSFPLGHPPNQKRWSRTYYWRLFGTISSSIYHSCAK